VKFRREGLATSCVLAIAFGVWVYGFKFLVRIREKQKFMSLLLMVLGIHV
jgi:hypothetical protein